MLSYLGNKQHPRKHPLPEDAVPKLGGRSVCSDCASHVFTATLAAGLVAAWETKQDVFTYPYERSARDIRQSSIDGCKWCQGLADGIYTFVHLESVYEMWNKSSSDSSSGGGEMIHSYG